MRLLQIYLIYENVNIDFKNSSFLLSKKSMTNLKNIRANDELFSKKLLDIFFVEEYNVHKLNNV